MKRTLTILTLILAAGLSARAQNGAVGDLTAASTDCTATSSCIQTEIPQTAGGATIQLAKTFSGTVQFEGNADVDAVTPANRTWVAILATPSSSSTAASSATSTGVWQVNVSAYRRIRVRVSTYSSGTIGATINLSQTSARGGSGGGGGGGSVNSGTAGQLSYYATTGTAVSGNSHLTYNSTVGGSPSLFNILMSDGSPWSWTIQDAAAPANSYVAGYMGVDGGYSIQSNPSGTNTGSISLPASGGVLLQGTTGTFAVTNTAATSNVPIVGPISTSTVSATGAPVSRTLAVSRADTFNVLDNGALGTNTGTAIGTTYGASVSALAGYTTATGATPFSWATNPLYGLTFTMAVSTNQATVATPLTFTETLTDGTWSATVALWQDPAHGNYLVQPGMAVTGSCIAANTTVSSVNRTAGNAGYGQVTLNQNTSGTCASTTVITFTLTNAQLQALTLDWLGIQTAVARADAANGAIGSEVDIPAGKYVINHPILNATGNTQGIKMIGGGTTSTILTASSDFGTDFYLIGEVARNGGSSASSYRDFQLVAPTQSLVMGTSPNGMDGLAYGSNAKIDAITTSYFHAGLNAVGNHWTARTITASNGGYGAYFAPYGSAAGVGNATITDSNLVGNTIASIAASTTNTIDSSTLTAVHTGFGPYGIYQEVKPSTVTTPRSLLTNSVLTNVYIESIGNAWIYAPNDFYGIVNSNQIIGGGTADVGGHSMYKIAANPVPGVIDVAVFNGNTIIGTNWSAFASVATAVVDVDGTCSNNTWINDDNFITGGTTSIPALSCGQGPLPSTFVTSFGSGTWFANIGGTLSTAYLPVTDLGGGTAQAYTTGTPFAGLVAAPAAAFTYAPVITYAPLLAGVTKATAGDTFTQGNFVYPATGGLKTGTAGAGAIGTVFGTSAGGTGTVSIRLDPMLGSAGATLAQPGAIRSTGLVASVSTATLCAASAGACNTAGTYHIHVAMYQGGTACTTNTTGGVSFQITWTDGNGSVHSAITVPLDTNSSLTATSGTMLFNQTASGIATVFGTGDFNVDTNGSIIQYATTYGNCSVTGTATYALSAAVRRLQ